MIVDARGMRCPWPVLRLARAMREGAAAVIVADDPAAPREIAALAEERGWSLSAIPTEIGEGWRVAAPGAAES
jgi:tRNA 2-thiouridine synthesizing protein A